MVAFMALPPHNAVNYVCDWSYASRNQGPRPATMSKATIPKVALPPPPKPAVGPARAHEVIACLRLDWDERDILDSAQIAPLITECVEIAYVCLLPIAADQEGAIAHRLDPTDEIDPVDTGNALDHLH